MLIEKHAFFMWKLFKGSRRLPFFREEKRSAAGMWRFGFFVWDRTFGGGYLSVAAPVVGFTSRAKAWVLPSE